MKPWTDQLELDRSYTVHGLGNQELLHLPWTAFFCSTRCPGGLILKSYDLAQRFRAKDVPVISGFHSPVEQEVLRVLIRSEVPVCLAPARGLPTRFTPEITQAVAAGRMLVLSPFSPSVKRANRESGEKRNHFVARFAHTVCIGYAEKGSRTEAMVESLLAVGKDTYLFDHPQHVPWVSRGTKSLDNELPQLTQVSIPRDLGRYPTAGE